MAAGEAPRSASLPFALYLGWISVASVVSVTIGLWAFGWQSPTNVSVVLALGLLIVVTGLGLLVSWVFSDMTFPLVVCWALVGIWVGQRNTYPELADAALIGAV